MSIPCDLSIRILSDEGGVTKVTQLFPDGPIEDFFGDDLTVIQMAQVGVALLNTRINPVAWRTYPSREDVEEFERVCSEGPAAAPTPAPSSGVRVEYVYLVRERGGAYKIGWTTSLERRVWDEISPLYPYPLELVAYHETVNGRGLEAEFHRAFQEKRLQGEWFCLADDDVARFGGSRP